MMSCSPFGCIVTILSIICNSTLLVEVPVPNLKKEAYSIRNKGYQSYPQNTPKYSRIYIALRMFLLTPCCRRGYVLDSHVC